MESRATVSITKLKKVPMFFDKNMIKLSLLMLTRVVGVNVYSEAEFSKPAICFLKIGKHMRASLKMGICPHHYILVDNLLLNPSWEQRKMQIFLYCSPIFNRRLRAAFLSINYQSNTTSILCAPCYSVESMVFYQIELGNRTTLNDMLEVSTKLKCQLRGALITSSATAIVHEEVCTTRRISDKLVFPNFGTYIIFCYHYILKSKHNLYIHNTRVA